MQNPLQCLSVFASLLIMIKFAGIEPSDGFSYFCIVNDQLFVPFFA
jgi:hypothetical protein